MERPPISDKILLEAVENQTISTGRRIEEKGRGALLSHHEMLGVITEIYHDLIEAVRQTDPVDVANELSRLGAACTFSIASMFEAEAQLKAAREALEAEVADIQGSEE